MVNLEGSFFFKGKLTCFALLNLCSRDGKNGKYFDHDFHHNFHHFRGRSDLDINFESSEEIFDTPEDVKTYVLVSATSSSCLKGTRESGWSTQNNLGISSPKEGCQFP
jgi:hypothetical protein